MIQVPVPPKTLATRQIRCICCQEQFTVSVASPFDGQKTKPRHWYDKFRPKQKRSASLDGQKARDEQKGRDNGWYVPANQVHRTRMRYEKGRDLRPVSPAACADPELDLESNPYRQAAQFYFITCPRCGADNRNWLNLQRELPFSRWQRPLSLGYFLSVLAVVAIIVLLFFPTILPQVNLSKWTRSIPLIICIFLAGLLPLLLIPGLWDPMRIRKYLSEVMSSLDSSLSPAAWRAAIILVVLAVLLPTLFYVIPPLVQEVKAAIFNRLPEATLVARIDEVSKRVNQLDESAPVNNAFNGLTAVLNTQPRTCEKTQIDQMIADLQAIAATSPHGNLLLVQSATNQLNVIRETANIECRKNLIENVSATLQPIIATAAIPPLPDTLTLPQCRSQWQAANQGQNVILDPACYAFMLAAIQVDLEAIKNAPLLSRTRAEILSQVRLLAADPSLLPGVQSQIASNMDTLENSLPASASAPLLDWRFLVFWFTAVSLTWLLCTICAFNAMNQRISWLDPHVPRPIFTSIAGMTRVAVWEAKHALEINDYEHRIQWTRAIRNEAGGIDLVGFFRDPPELLPDGTRSSQVRAQRYGVSTDMWCRIREARITDMMTQRPVGGPAIALPEFAPTTAIVTVGRERR